VLEAAQRKPYRARGNASMEQYESKYRETQIHILRQKAKELGFQVH
jgi:hypothetical protein